MKNKRLGAWGEELAKNYLRNKGYIIKAQNLHLGHLELDLIAQKNGIIFLFEIKTRLIKIKTRSINYKLYTDNYLSQKQILNLKKAASIYAALNKLSFKNINFGLITVTLTNTTDQQKTATINLYLNIF